MLKDVRNNFPVSKNPKVVSVKQCKYVSSKNIQNKFYHLAEVYAIKTFCFVWFLAVAETFVLFCTCKVAATNNQMLQRP